MIFIWICIILSVACGIGGGIFFIVNASGKRAKIIGAVSCIAVGIVIAALLFWWLYWTESGERMQKSFHSNTSGGLYRTIEVYDIQGNKIKSYEGKFDIQEYQNNGIVKIKFDLNGERHIIFSQTGTVLIDEISEPPKDKYHGGTP